MNQASTVQNDITYKYDQILMKKRRKKIRRAFLVFFLYSLIIAYFISPLSRINFPLIAGNRFITNEEIFEYSTLDRGDFLWNGNYEFAEKNLKQHPFIGSAKINYSLFGVKIFIDEIIIVAKSTNSTEEYSVTNEYYLSNGKIMLLENNTYAKEFYTRVERVPTYFDYFEDGLEKRENKLFQIGQLEHEITKKMLSFETCKDKTICDYSFETIVLSFRDYRIANDLKIVSTTLELNKFLSIEFYDAIVSKVKNDKSYLLDKDYCVTTGNDKKILKCR